jgi:hypothetical protein
MSKFRSLGNCGTLNHFGVYIEKITEGRILNETLEITQSCPAGAYARFFECDGLRGGVA